MSVVSKVRGFFTKHRNKFILGGVLITGSILLTRYAQQRLKDWQERETREFFERNRKQNHFESIGRTCNQTVLNLSTALFDVVFKIVDTDEIIEKLKHNPENKLELWNDLKVLVFCKAGVMIYSTVMLVITLKIQLSIIGGYLYKDPNSVTTDMQERYLSLCQNFLNVGVKKLAVIVESEVKKIVQSIDFKKQLRISDIEAICWSIQTALSVHRENPVEQLRNYILYDEILNSSNNLYSDILRDTADFLDSDEVKSLTTHCVNGGFVLLGDQISEFYNQFGSEASSGGTCEEFKNPFSSRKPLAKLVPIINGLLTKQSIPHHLVQQLITSEKLQVLGANVYESLL